MFIANMVNWIASITVYKHTSFLISHNEGLSATWRHQLITDRVYYGKQDKSLPVSSASVKKGFFFLSKETSSFNIFADLWRFFSSEMKIEHTKMSTSQLAAKQPLIFILILLIYLVGLHKWLFFSSGPKFYIGDNTDTKKWTKFKIYWVLFRSCCFVLETLKAESLSLQFECLVSKGLLNSQQPTVHHTNHVYPCYVG